MGILRSVLLWGSRSASLREALPRFRFVRRAVTRFMPGEDADDALTAAEGLRAKGIAAVVTHLGENLVHETEANTVAQHYLDLLDRIRERQLDCQISVKLTQLGLDLSEQLSAAHLAKIVLRAKDLGNFVWIDMESSDYVERTLSSYRRILSEHSNVGVCLQSYLYRTADDLEKLLPLAPSIRLVKGTYAEPKHIAYASKKSVDESFLNLAKQLLDAARSNHAQVGIGTHDEALLERIFQSASGQGIARDTYEIQMLYGIKREYQLRLAREGFRVRILISYGKFWFPWYMRRLAERPANVLFVLKNIFTR
jgi:proline dehydrogenase